MFDCGLDNVLGAKGVVGVAGSDQAAIAQEVFPLMAKYGVECDLSADVSAVV